jgi:hypothetical protein
VSSPNLVFVFSLIASETVAGALAGQATRAPNTYGAGGSVLTIPAVACGAQHSDTLYTTLAGERYRNGGPGGFEAGVFLPAGALVTQLELDGCDSSVTATLSAQLLACAGGSCSVLEQLESGQAEAPGCAGFRTAVNPALTIDNEANAYILHVNTQAGDSSTRFRSVPLLYHLQVSPPPAVPTFADVPANFLYFRAIEALAAAGITSGCGGGNFCPNQPVTRGEIAKFLANALGLHWH